MTNNIESKQLDIASEDIVKKSGLLDFCKQYSRVFLYGAGDFGFFYAGILAASHVTVTAFIVTKNKPASHYCGLPVYEISEIANDLTSQDGVILSARSGFHASMKMALPEGIHTYGIGEHLSFQLQWLYFRTVLYKDMKEVFTRNHFLDKLRSGGDIWDNTFRVFSALCNEDVEDPSVVFSPKIVWLKKYEENQNNVSFPISDTGIVMQGPICRENDFGSTSKVVEMVL